MVRATGQGSPMICFCMFLCFYLPPGFASGSLGLQIFWCFFLRLGGCLPRPLSLRRKQNAKQTQSKRQKKQNERKQNTTTNAKHTVFGMFLCFCLPPPSPKTHKKRKTSAKQTQSKRNKGTKQTQPKMRDAKMRKTEMHKKHKPNTE